MNTPKSLPAATPDDIWEQGAWQMIIACLRQLVSMSAEIDRLTQSVAVMTEKYPVKPADRTLSSPPPEDSQS